MKNAFGVALAGGSVVGNGSLDLTTISIRYHSHHVLGLLLLIMLTSGCEAVRLKSNRTVVRVLVTPLAVAADTVMVGLVASVVGAYMLAKGNYEGSFH